MSEYLDRAAKARDVNQQRAAERAIDDPMKLARAARIIRTAIARNRLTLDDLIPPSAQAGGRDG